MLSTMKIVSEFSGIIEARILKLGIHIDNELLYLRIENRKNGSSLPFGCPFSVFSMLIRVTVFSGTMQG